MTEHEARLYLNDLDHAGAARLSGIRTARAGYHPALGYFVTITDAAVAFARHTDPTFAVPADWTPLDRIPNATRYTWPALLEAQAIVIAAMEGQS
ncbi:MAG: hypothetical protein WBA46_00160 [Thermomicrobiales bacterium]